MSMTFYTYQPDATSPTGSHGPLDEIDSEFHYYGPRTLDATPEQELAAGWCNGPNLSNSNAAMVLRSLGLPTPDDGCGSYDPTDLLGRCLTALAVGGATADDGQPTITSRGNGATMIDVGVRPGYFADVYSAIVPVCERAIAWNTNVVVA